MAEEGRTMFRGWLAALCFGFALLGGCATVSTGSRVDVERLLNAVAIDDTAYVRDLVASGKLTVDERVPAPVYPDGAPLITLAAREGSVGVLTYLVSSGADIDATTPVGETALMLATFFPNEERDQASQDRYEKAVRLLLDAGASLENTAYDYTALSYAAYQNRQRIMRHLLARGARVDGVVAGAVTYVNTPLMMAAIQGHYEAAVSLLRAGANPRIRSYRGHTAADLAARHQHRELASMLQCAQRVAAAQSFAPRCL